MGKVVTRRKASWAVPGAFSEAAPHPGHAACCCPPGDRAPFNARADEWGPELWECEPYPHKVWDVRNIDISLMFLSR